MSTKTVLAATLAAILGISGKTAPSETKQKSLEEQLCEIGIRSTIDNIERGGIITGQTVHEIENGARHSPEKLKEFINGQDQNYSELKSYILSALSVRCACEPELAPLYNAYSTDLNFKLDLMLALKPEQRQEIAQITKTLFGRFLPGGIYFASSNDASRVYNPNGIHFHTHPLGDPPSLQDIKLSHERPEYVVSVTKERKYTLYLVDKGKVTILYER